MSEKKIHVFTSAALNYLPKARALFRSIRTHHPEFVLHLALSDDPRGLVDIGKEPFDNILPISELDIPSWLGWAFCHNIVELSTAIKPFVMKALLQRSDCAKVIYLDPDMVVFSRLDDIVAALDEVNIVLTPHQVVPERTLEAVMDNEICSLKHGVYNLGFVGVAASDEGARFADWWSNRVYHFCRADIPHGLFTDQRWIDLVPAFFDGVGIIRSSRHNVAPWNITTRTLTGSAREGYAVDGAPLGFYHFTGFDSGAHKIMAAKNGARNESLSSLIDWYSAETKSSRSDPLSAVPWAYGQFFSGRKISAAQRLVYRERPDLQEAFTNPFDDSNEKSYLSWWNQQGQIEYPLMQNPITEEEGMKPLRALLSPGFNRGYQAVNLAAVARKFAVGIASPSHGVNLVARAARIAGREGVSGLIRKLRTIK